MPRRSIHSPHTPRDQGFGFARHRRNAKESLAALTRLLTKKTDRSFLEKYQKEMDRWRDRMLALAAEQGCDLLGHLGTRLGGKQAGGRQRPGLSRPIVGDPNVTIHEAKVFVCNVTKG